MEKKGKILTALIIIIIIMLMAVVTFFFGFRGIWKVITSTFWIAFIITIIVIIAWGFYYFFIKKHRFDATAVNKSKLITAGQMQCPNTLKNHYLRLSGDKGHAHVIFGKIVGYLQIQILSKVQVTDKDGNLMYEQFGDHKKEVYEVTNEPQDVFIIQKGGLMNKVFGENLVVRTHPKDHSELVGDVTLYGFNLVPISEYWFLSSDYLDTVKIDKAILHESGRGIAFEVLKDAKKMIDNSINLDARHRKDVEEKAYVQLPAVEKYTQ